MRDLPRREFLAGLGTLAAGTILPYGNSAAQSTGAAAGKPYRIDVHHHLVPPVFLAEINARHTNQAALQQWTPAKAIEEMDQGQVACSIASISEPGVYFGDVAAGRKLARECNEYGAKLMADYPGRFGLFAIVPLPDVEGSLQEIEYGLDILKADGICMMTSYEDKHLGHPSYAPVMDELNRRKAVVFVHPYRNECCRNLVPDVSEPVIELGTDTTRTIADLLVSGTTARCPDIRFIFSHGGGTVPFLLGRFLGLGNNKTIAARIPKGMMYEVQKLYFDTAQVYNRYALPSLTAVMPASHIMFGTDYPSVTAETTGKGLSDFGLSARDLSAIERDNAISMFPRLKA